jgi:hypothetical protein
MQVKTLLHKLIEKCDIYFENEIISREHILKNYSLFLASSFESEKKQVCLTFHPGSFCFDVLTVLFYSIGTLFLDVTDIDEMLFSLHIGDMVLFKNERYQWGGLGSISAERNFIIETDLSKATHFMIEQRKQDKSMGQSLSRSIQPITKKNLIIPYYGKSETTDGRGLRKRKSNKQDFISKVFDFPLSEITNIVGVSTALVADRELADRLMHGISLKYEHTKQINLLDIVTASYFTDDEEYPYRGNSGKNDPVIKITNRISIARDLILDKSRNKVVSFIVLGGDNLTKGRTELPELLERKAIMNIAFCTNIDYEGVEEVLDSATDAKIFACTPDYLKTVPFSCHQSGPNIISLRNHINYAINCKINQIILPGPCTWNEYQKAKQSLFYIKNNTWDGPEKDEFITYSYSLLNFFNTAVFSISDVENYYSRTQFSIQGISPRKSLEKLWSLADEFPTELTSYTLEVLEILEKMIRSQVMKPTKYRELKKQLYFSKDKRLAVIVPKTYYIEILSSVRELLLDKVSIIPANRFDNTMEYDEIIVTGDFHGKRFNTFRTKSAPIITVLLYAHEQPLFSYKQQQAIALEKQLNRIILNEDQKFISEHENELPLNDNAHNILANMNEETINLERYIENILDSSISKFIQSTSVELSSSGIDVVSIGTFESGEKILLTKYYKAFVFDAVKGNITETDVGKLCSGDTLVFTKKDGFAKNIVDNIFDSLITSGNLSHDVQEAEFKSKYWKLLLKEYMDKNHLTYKELSEHLSTYGCNRHEVTIKTWLNDDYRIIGPNDELAFAQIAELTGDPDLLSDYKGFYESCRIVRHKRREILSLVGQAIIDKLRGNTPRNKSLLKAVYDNVESLAVMLKLDLIVELKNPNNTSINLVNKPLFFEEG